MQELATTILRAILRFSAAALCLAGLGLGLSSPSHADEAFRAWIETVWPEASAAGVSRGTFEAAVSNLEPDYKLPDLDLPGRDSTGSKGQAEFTRAPADYLDKKNLANLAATGKTLLAKYKPALDKIERELGVDRYSLLAIWGRETGFGSEKLANDAIVVLATEAYVGRRKDMFRAELIAALKMLEAGVPRSLMRASWAGAIGLTQFMPTEYFKHARDIDGDGKIDIWNSVPDALGSAASQLAGKGWVRGERWGYEVRLTPQADCSLEGPVQARTIGDWSKLGLKPATGRPWTPHELGLEAYLMSPAGAYGPSFLVTENFKVLRLYNTSDLYAVFVGDLADRIAGRGDFLTPWGGTGPQKTKSIEEIQKHLQSASYDVAKIDGKIGSNTRMVIGAYQKANNLKVDCWPTDAVLAHVRASSSR